MLYVAYGSNMNIEQMAFRCPKSRIVGNGIIKGWRLIFNIHADIIEASEYDEVPVVCWEIDDSEWKNLDRYEGYPSYYVKRLVSVEMDGGGTKKCIVYVMNDSRKGISPPYRSYFDVCLQGYIDNGIDTEYLYDALRYSWDNETEYNQYSRKGAV